MLLIEGACTATLGTGVEASGRSPLLAGRRIIEIEVGGHWHAPHGSTPSFTSLAVPPRNPAMRDFDAGGIRSAPPTTLAATELNAPTVGALGRFIAECPSTRTPKRSLAGSAKDGGGGSSTGIAARAIRRTRKKAGLSRPQGRAATFARDGSDRTAASAELNVSRETLSAGIGAAHSRHVADHCDPAAFIHLSGARHLVR